MMNQAVETLKTLMQVYGPSGHEEQIAGVIEEMVRPYVDEVYRDALGSVIAVKRCGGKKVMLAGHMDQIGYIVTHIDENGFLRVANVGGVTPQWELFHAVRFENGVRGIVGFETKHEDYRTLKTDHLFIDIGAESYEEARSMVNVGDMCIFEAPVIETEKRLTGPYLDDRIGCAMIIEALKKLENCKYDVYAAFTVQEEVGCRGGHTTAFGIEPDIGVACDITPSPDTPETTKICSVKVGCGPAIKVKDGHLIAHPVVRRWMEDSAEAANIPVQNEVLAFGGTDAGDIALSRAGVKAGTLSIATRFGHSVAETVSIRDYEQCIDLLVSMLQRDYE
ncbi:MAG: M42 family metallopeptidase [Eubacteriales bacterium]|nr:M42 family metallopeptidase [Eubacteriales bacterium]